MTTKDFAQRMNIAIENAKYFTLVGYHIMLSLSPKTEMVDLNIFYKEDSDEEFIRDSTTMKVEFQESEGARWAKLS